jgi:hypothetical protein
METKRPAASADATTGVSKGGAGHAKQTQPTGSSTATSAPSAAGAEGGFYRVAGVGLLLLVIGLGVLFYSASILTLTCRADNDPNPYVSIPTTICSNLFCINFFFNIYVYCYIYWRTSAGSERGGVSCMR